MNVMAQAHKMTRITIEGKKANGLKTASYRVIFKAQLRIAHKEFKAAQKPVCQASLDAIARMEARLEALKAVKDLSGYVVTIEGQCIDWTKLAIVTIEQAPVCESKNDADYWSTRVRDGRGCYGVAISKFEAMMIQQSKLVALIKEIKDSL